jgi:hypothetical protein
VRCLFIHLLLTSLHFTIFPHNNNNNTSAGRGKPESETPLYSLIIIIIIIIIITISFMQGIYTNIPETNNVPKEYNVAAILSLLFMEPIIIIIIMWKNGEVT